MNYNGTTTHTDTPQLVILWGYIVVLRAVQYSNPINSVAVQYITNLQRQALYFSFLETGDNSYLYQDIRIRVDIRTKLCLHAARALPVCVSVYMCVCGESMEAWHVYVHSYHCFPSCCDNSSTLVMYGRYRCTVSHHAAR